MFQQNIHNRLKIRIYTQVSSHIYNVTGETSREEMKGTYIKHTIMFIERALNSRLDQYLIRIQRAGLK